MCYSYLTITTGTVNAARPSAPTGGKVITAASPRGEGLGKKWC